MIKQTELENHLYRECLRDPDLLETVIRGYLAGLSSDDYAEVVAQYRDGLDQLNSKRSATVQQIKESMATLCQLNTMNFDYWVSELFDDDGKEDWSMWTDSTLSQIDKDIKQEEERLSDMSVTTPND